MWKWPGPEVRVRVSTYWLVAIGVLVTIAVMFGDADRDVGAFLNKWQTLIAGLLAIVAAWVSLTGPREQVRQADQFNRDLAEREENAARAMLPLALNYITEYARECMTRTEERFHRSGYTGNPISLPEFDRSNLALVRDCVRYAPSLYRSRMIALLNAIQILEAFAISEVTIVPEYALFVRSVEVEYLCDMLFDYARQRPDNFDADAPVQPPPDYVRRAARFRQVGEDFWPSLDDDLTRRETTEIRPGGEA